jgi:hypothetical protein
MLEADPVLPLKKSTLALVFFAHFMLVGSHILGPLFSGIFIAGLVGQDLWARQFRPQLYLSALAGWVVLVVSFKEIQTTAALGKPIFWTPKPHLKDLALGAAAFSTPLFCIMVAAAFIAVCATRFRREAVPAETPAIRRTPLYFLLASFAGIYLVSLGISLVTTSIFYNRYMLPLLFADGLILCELVHRTGRTLPRHSLQRHAAIGAGLLLLAGIYQRHYVYIYHFPESDFTPEIVAKAAGRPIVLADAAVFTQMAFYHNGQATLATPIDWSIITDPKAGALLTSGTHEMENWKRDGFYSADILTTPEILGRFPDFLLVSNPSAPFWYRKYVADNPNYEVKPLGIVHDDELYLVHLRGTLPLVATDRAGLRTR